MSFKLEPAQGTVEEIDVELSLPAQHEREEFVISEVKKAIHHVVSALGGYLSVSCNGNINPVSGETGDLVQIYITSLPAPTISTPAQTPPVEEVQTGEPTSVTEETPQPQPPVTPENVEPTQQQSAPSEPPVTVAEVEATTDSGEIPAVVEPPAETPPVIQENPVATEPTPAPENPAEIAPEVTAPITPGQAEAQEIAQATPPVEPAV